MQTVLAEAPNVADWISAIGQALGALFTAAAVIVALWIAHRDYRSRQADELARWWAQARLVRVKRAAEYGNVIFFIKNLSDFPLLDLFIEVVVRDDAGARSRVIRSEDIYLPEPHMALSVKATEEQTECWRVSWTDPQGARWFVDDEHPNAQILKTHDITDLKYAVLPVIVHIDS